MSTSIFRLLMLLFIPTASSCSNCSNEEIWREKIELADGSHVMVYHSSQCGKEKPFFCPTEKKIDYIQMKYDAFDFCMSEDDINLLLSISNYNIGEKEEYFFPEEVSDIDYYSSFMSLVDTTYHPYECYYSLNERKLIPLNTPFKPR